MIVILPPTREAITISIGEGVGIGFELHVIELDPVADVCGVRPDARDLYGVRTGGCSDVRCGKIEDDARVAIHAIGIEQRGRARTVLETRCDVVRAEAFAHRVRQTQPNATPDEFKAES